MAAPGGNDPCRPNSPSKKGGIYTCWIDPKDFMPEANKNVLVKCSSGEIQTDFYAPELGGFFIEHSTHAKVTGWREMM